MLLDTLKEDAALAQLPDAALERIIDNTFSVASKEGKLLSEHSIGPGEWLSFCTRSPSILNNMTLPVLRELTTVRRGAALRSRTKEIPNKRRFVRSIVNSFAGLPELLVEHNGVAQRHGRPGRPNRGAAAGEASDYCEQMTPACRWDRFFPQKMVPTRCC